MFSPAEISLISFALASDSIVTSWFSGALHQKLKLNLGLKLPVFLAVGRLLFLISGLVAGHLLSAVLTNYVLMAGLSVISIVGIKLMIESIRFVPEERVILLDNNRTILLVTIAGSINTLIAGTGMGIIGSGLLIPGAVTLPVVAAFSYTGIKAGIRFGYRPVIRFAGLISGTLVSLVAIRHFILHLIN